ncbi:MAG: CRISPR-associated RAMP protein [Ktedonobacteraceae bacterium]|nr:CRISPR-associated RAMP protein [Ktedonobacteraceae bacterium]
MTQDSTKNTQDTQQMQPMRYQLRNRYVFDGKLGMTTGLHIGGGKVTLSYTDSPVVQTPEGLPFIPGSSFKGTLRSTIEKIVASLPADLGLHSCGLPAEEMPPELESCPTAHQKEIADARSKDSKALEKVRKDLCQTCQLFGSPFAASRITVNDLYLINDEWSGTTQIRDGVAIDRDSETAKSGAKYDFEVVPSTTVFRLHLVIENATEQDLQLISIGLSEFVSGFSGVGGFRSRGLGACILKDLQIRYMELTDAERKQRLQRYLLRKKDGQDDGLDLIDAQDFFDKHISLLFEPHSRNQ